MHREIMESRIPSNYFYIPFVYICFIYVEQRTGISVQRYCNNRMYILVKEYRIIFCATQVFYYACSKTDRLFYDYGGKDNAFHKSICPLENKIITIKLVGISFDVYRRTSHILILKHPMLFFYRIR